jgi:metacaspase-1
MPTKRKGLALTIGLNAVNPRHYQGWSGELTACEADARDMSDIAKSKNFQVTTLLTKRATRAGVQRVIASAAKALKSGDIFMLTYSGHGGQLPDLNGDEADAQDETWCLYDGELVDDELYAALGAFARGVRILVFSDSCHSGTVIKLAYLAATVDHSPALRVANALGQNGPPRFRAMPPQVALRTYEANKRLYDPILESKALRKAADHVKASALLISGCQDNQLSADGTFNGLFTGTLRRVWNGGQFKGDYRRFHKAILLRMPPDQSPNYFRAGERDPAFEAQSPFAV